jgi:hypothetical protein
VVARRVRGAANRGGIVAAGGGLFKTRTGLTTGSGVTTWSCQKRGRLKSQMPSGHPIACVRQARPHPCRWATLTTSRRTNPFAFCLTTWLPGLELASHQSRNTVLTLDQSRGQSVRTASEHNLSTSRVLPCYPLRPVLPFRADASHQLRQLAKSFGLARLPLRPVANLEPFPRADKHDLRLQLHELEHLLRQAHPT